MAFMRPLNHVIVDGKSLSDFGVYVSGDGTFNAPERDYAVTEVPGRSGTSIMTMAGLRIVH